MACERQQFLWRQRFDTCRHDRCWKEPGPSPLPCAHNAAHGAVRDIIRAGHQSLPVVGVQEGWVLLRLAIDGSAVFALLASQWRQYIPVTVRCQMK
jgi:hypothetical protein